MVTLAKWLPKRKEMPEQCAGCPFRDDNEQEFLAILKKLAKHFGERAPKNTKLARLRIMDETSMMGDFVCHASAYDLKTMDMREPHEHRQCPGATKHHRAEIERRFKERKTP